MQNELSMNPVAEPSRKRKTLMAIVVVLFCIALNALVGWRNSPPPTPKILAPQPAAQSSR